MKRCFALLLALCLLLSISSPALADNVLRLPSSLKSIDEDAFRGDTSIDEVILPNGIESLGAGAFAESSLTKINLPDSLTEIADDALPSPGLVTVTANEGTDAYNWALDKGYIVPEGSVVINETNFPDENFRGYVSANFDTDENGVLSPAELAAVEEINCSGQGIADLTGIKNFTALKKLNCGGGWMGDSCKLTELDVSGMTALEELVCDNGGGMGAVAILSSLNVSGCTALTKLKCNGNNLTALNLSTNTALLELDCSHGTIEALDLSHNPNLTKLACDGNALTELDLSHNDKLTELTMSQMALGYLDLSGNPELAHVKGGPAVMNIAGCPILLAAYEAGMDENYERPVWLPDNVNVYGDEVMMINNATIILTDDSDIPIVAALFPDETFRGYVSENFDTDENGALSPAELAAVEEINCAGMDIADLSGIKFFTALKKLNCGGNMFAGGGALTALDVSGMTALETLEAGANPLQTLNVQGCTALKELYCHFGALSTLDVTGCPALSVLDCRGMNLTALDLTHNRELTSMKCDHNQITSLNLSQNGKLKVLTTEGCPITALDLSQNGALEELDCGGNQLMALDVSHNPALTKLTCAGNQLSTLNLSQNGALRELYCGQNLLTALDVSGHKALVSLGCFHEGPLALNITGCPTLVEAYENGLTLADPGPWIPEGATVYTDGTNSVLTIGPNTTVTSNAA